jgi:hypothetical protein
MSRKALISSTFLVVLGGVGPGIAAGDERWRRPLPGGAVVAPFTYERAAPYERGRRRGIDIHAATGSPVLAACTGTITYAGRVPRFGRGVTIHCGRLVATELGLSKTLVSRGTRVTSGTPLGLLGPTGTLRLGARLASSSKAYINPEPLLANQPPQLAPLPPARRLHRPRPRRFDPPHASPSRPPFPWLTLAGAATLASAALGGTTFRIHRRRRRRLYRTTVVARQAGRGR